MVRVCIIGAGVVGLTTAWQVTEKIKEATVVVYASKFTVETTSHGAAGILDPQPGMINPSIFDQVCADSKSYFNSLVKSSEAKNAGVSVVDGYQLRTKIMPNEEENYRKFAYYYAEIQPDSLIFLPDASKFCRAYHFTTLLIECRCFLPWMMKKLEERGVRFIRRFITNLDELVSEDFDILFNCCGLGNQHLIGDTRLFPVRGQVARVRAPWVKQFFRLDEDTYIYPGADLLVLGGCRQKGDYNLKVDEADSLSIMSRCKELVPSLVDAVVDHEWVGLRPYRDVIRIEETECIINPVNGHKTRVICNYGHGGNGVGMSVGSACLAVSLACQSPPNA